MRPSGSPRRRAGSSVSGRWCVGVTVEMGEVIQRLHPPFFPFDPGAGDEQSPSTCGTVRGDVLIHKPTVTICHRTLHIVRRAFEEVRSESRAGSGSRFQGLATSPTAGQVLRPTYVIPTRQTTQQSSSMVFLGKTVVVGHGSSRVCNISPDRLPSPKHSLRPQNLIRT